jgi:hypothetical protein
VLTEVNTYILDLSSYLESLTMTSTPWPLEFGVGEEQGGSGEAVATVGGVSFPPLRASGKWSCSSLLGQAW